MAFCRHCGAEIATGARFCAGCGTQVKGAPAAGSRPTTAKAGGAGRGPAARPAASAMRDEVRGYMFFGLAGLGGLAVLSLLVSNSLGLILSAALGTAAYFLAFRKLEEGDLEGAKNASLIIGVVVGLIGLAVVLMRDMMGLLDILVAVPFLMAWNALK